MAERRRRRLLRREIHEDTRSAGVGPLSIDCVMARRHGWSERQIARAYRLLGAISGREGSLSHRRGPVKGCRCVVCDPQTSNDDLREVLGYHVPRWREGHRPSSTGLWEWEKRQAPPRQGPANERVNAAVGRRRG